MLLEKRFTLALLMVFAALAIFTGGCGKKAEDAPAEGTEGEQPAEGEAAQQEAARPNTPPPPPQQPAATPQAAPAKPAAPAPGAPGAPGGKPGAAKGPPQIKQQQIPDNVFLKIEFDTKEAALVATFAQYAAKLRRNIFRDIKSSAKLRKDAETTIEAAKRMCEKVKGMPAGSYTEPLYKQADENVKQAESAFKDQNYFKAKAIAEKAYELAEAAIIKKETNEKQGKVSLEIVYNGFYQLGEDKTAMITKKNQDDGSTKVMMIKVGDVVSEDLPATILVEGPDGNQVKVNKIEYQVEDITDEDISIANVTEKKPAFRVALTKPGEGFTEKEKKDKDEKDKKEKEKKEKEKKDQEQKKAATAPTTFTTNTKSGSTSGSSSSTTTTSSSTTK